MMDAYLILNIGNSDMRPRQPVLQPAALAAQMAAVPAVDWSDVEFPILEKYLAYVKLHRLALRRVFLVGTEQSATASDEHRAKDTLPVARLMARWLKERVPETSAEVMVYGGNPTDWDAVHAFFRRELPRRAGTGRHLVGITGGTQQLNTTLLLNALDEWPKVTPLAAAEGRPQPWAVGIGHRLRERDLVRAIASHLQHWDFHAALSLLEQEEALPSDARRRNLCRALIRHALHRSNFRFQEAAQALSDALADAPDDEGRTVANVLLTQAAALDSADLAPGDPAARDDESLRLREMVNLAEQYLQRGLLLELPALVYTFTDITLKLLSDRLGVHFIRDQSKGWPRLDSNWVAKQPGLLDHLEKRQCRWEGPYDTGVGLDVVEWFAANGHPLARSVWKELMALDGVRKLRHRGPFGHGTVGVSDKGLRDAYGKKGAPDVVLALRNVAGQLAPAAGDSPFDLVTTQVLRLLRQV